MPTYATTADFDLSIDDIAEEAFERCGLQTRSGYDIKTARRSIASSAISSIDKSKSAVVA